MRVKKKPLTAIETLNILEKYWINANDIKAIACVGESKAQEIKKEIVHLCDLDNIKLPYGLVPADKVIDYLKINIKYLKQCANFLEKKTPSIKR